MAPTTVAFGPSPETQRRGTSRSRPVNRPDSSARYGWRDRPILPSRMITSGSTMAVIAASARARVVQQLVDDTPRERVPCSRRGEDRLWSHRLARQ